MEYIQKQHLLIRKDIDDAINNNQPVLALESTIISHGMPYPQNIETALSVEKIVSDHEVIPATIAIINGKIIIGLQEEEMQLLAHSNQVLKASRLDLPLIVSRKLNASTTVAATMICAEMAGIEFFTTGGIGGVHRGAEQTFDISADLQELAKTNVSVICAGAKAILDLDKTMEYLETMGVMVIGYQTDHLPAFYSRESHIPLLYRSDNAEDIAQIVASKRSLNLNGGILITNPIPKQYSLPFSDMDHYINSAIKEAEMLSINGKKLTPFLLSKISDLTSGKSLESNIALIKNNALLGAQIAKAYKELCIRIKR